jgi:predicted amidohydrolase YtcJ
VTTTLFSGGTVRTVVGDDTAGWALVSDNKIIATGAAGDEPAADRTVDMYGATLIPGFCDAHAHMPATGLYASGLDFRRETRAQAILDAYRDRADRAGGVLFGGNFEDPLDEPLNRHLLDSAVGGRLALLARADMHSCVVSSALLQKLDVGGLEGVDIDDDGAPTGYLREKAAAEAWRWFDTNLPPEQEKEAIRTAVRLAYSKGITGVHDMYVVEWRGWRSLDVLAEVMAAASLDWSPYVATNDIGRIKAIGLPRIGGDWFLDGSFGSHTAWLSLPYDPPPPPGSPSSGISYRSDDEVVSFFCEAQRAGLQTGVHAIGDAAIEQALRSWETVAQAVGLDEVRSLRHRFEHFECSSDEHIARARNLNIGISVQPAFDRYWGGEGGMYAQRIGWDRAQHMNRFKTMLEAGLVVGAGSDSTVTPLDPFLQMAALREHHLPEQRVDALDALRCHTLGAQRLSRSEYVVGTIEDHRFADLALLSRDPAETPSDELGSIEVLGTWVRGIRVWPPEDAEAD